jgi:hypothetical protein
VLLSKSSLFLIAVILLIGTAPLPAVVVNGIDIPTGHPRLWFDAARLAQARAWFAANPFTASDHAGHDEHRERALECLLGGNATVCRAAVDWAMGVSVPVPGGVSCDECRWSGQDAILTFDWAYDHFTAAERATFISRWNGFLSNWMTKPWGGSGVYAYNAVAMDQNNYYWGYLRNELEWGIASYGENPQAGTFLQDALVTRWQTDFIPHALTYHKGGVAMEGDQYGPYLYEYPMISFFTANMYGRNILNESDFFKGGLLATIYATTPSPTTRAGATTGYEFYPFNDSDFWRYGAGASTTSEATAYADFVGTMASYFRNIPLGRWAQQWLNMTGASPRSPHITSVDPNVTPLSFNSLPVDYFAPGPGFFYGRTSWAPDTTAFLLQLGQAYPVYPASSVGHRHDEVASFSIVREGRWLVRNDSSYGETVVGGDPSGLLGNNTLMINRTNVRYNRGNPVVRRVESRPEYAFANVDITTVYGTAASNVEREYIYIRSLDTMVIFDRINTSGSTTKTFLAHFEQNPTIEDATHLTVVNGAEALRLTTLVPANPNYQVIAEGGIGQYRLEADAVGTQNYFLNVLQTRDASAANLTATVLDNGSSYTATLAHPTRGTVTLTVNKGASSAGGSLAITSQSFNLNPGVQSISITDNGPVWEPLGGNPPPPPSGSACDINGDSSTNVSDVQLCANQAIGVIGCTTGDINHDTSCNVVDVQRVVNAALGGQCVTQ